LSEPAGGESPEDWEMVAEVQDIYEAELVALRLRGEGLEARVVDQSFRQEPIPSVRAFAVVRVFVPADRAGEARQLLSEAGGPVGDAESEES
jgi:hypothetical protein